MFGRKIWCSTLREVTACLQARQFGCDWWEQSEGSHPCITPLYHARLGYSTFRIPDSALPISSKRRGGEQTRDFGRAKLPSRPALLRQYRKSSLDLAR